jgi:uncharacterized protein
VKRTALGAVGAILGVLVLLLLYGSLVEPRLILDERRDEAPIPGLGEPRAGTEVAVFSDLQIGMWWANTGMVQRIVDRVVAAEPDVVLLGGDFLYGSSPDPTRQVDTVMTLLRPLLDSGIPTYAVLGNHDYASGGAQEMEAALEQAGVPVLDNEAQPVPGDGELYVVGLGPARMDRADVDEALRGVPEDAPRVVLMHNPTSFPALPARSAPLALAGHTHCGQIALPGRPHWSYLQLTEEEALVAGGYAFDAYGEPGNRLFVTCGVGFSLLPLRVNAPPQVVFFELQPAS